MLVKPNTALTGVPSGRVIGGRAWKARNMNPDPSIRIRWSLRSSGGASSGAARTSMSVPVAGSFLQCVEARAVEAPVTDDGAVAHPGRGFPVAGRRQDDSDARGAFNSAALWLHSE